MVVPWEAPQIGENVVECSTVLQLQLLRPVTFKKTFKVFKREGILEADVDVFTR